MIQLSVAPSAHVDSSAPIDHHAPSGSLNGPRIATRMVPAPTSVTNNTVSHSQSSASVNPMDAQKRASALRSSPRKSFGRSLMRSRIHAIKISVASSICSPAHFATPNRATAKANSEPMASKDTATLPTLRGFRNSLSNAIATAMVSRTASQPLKPPEANVARPA